jgi:hypothetical protein
MSSTTSEPYMPDRNSARLWPSGGCSSSSSSSRVTRDSHVGSYTTHQSRQKQHSMPCNESCLAMRNDGSPIMQFDACAAAVEPAHACRSRCKCCCTAEHYYSLLQLTPLACSYCGYSDSTACCSVPASSALVQGTTCAGTAACAAGSFAMFALPCYKAITC